MIRRLNQLLDKLSEYLSRRKGLLPLLGIFLIAINFVIQFFSVGWLSESNLLLHLGAILAIFGIVLGWAL
jgi:hypothetical protein